MPLGVGNRTVVGNGVEVSKETRNVDEWGGEEMT